MPPHLAVTVLVEARQLEVAADLLKDVAANWARVAAPRQALEETLTTRGRQLLGAVAFRPPTGQHQKNAMALLQLVEAFWLQRAWPRALLGQAMVSFAAELSKS